MFFLIDIYLLKSRKMVRIILDHEHYLSYHKNKFHSLILITSLRCILSQIDLSVNKYKYWKAKLFTLAGSR